MTPERRAAGSTDELAAELLADGVVALEELRVDPVTGDVLWSEARPEAGGACRVVRSTSTGEQQVLTPEGFSVGSRVQEYGGGAFDVQGDVLVVSNKDDGSVHAFRPGEQRELVAPGEGRFGDLSLSPDGRVLAVREELIDGCVESSVVLLHVDQTPGRGLTTLLSGADFYASPVADPSGDRICWRSWNHPAMPWDAATLWVADLLGDGDLGHPRRVAGGDGTSVPEARWGGAGQLWFSHDDEEWWRLYRHDGTNTELVLNVDGDVGGPAYWLGSRSFAVLDDDRALVVLHRAGVDTLLIAHADQGRSAVPVDLDATSMSHVGASAGRWALLAGGPATPMHVVDIDPDTHETRALQRAASILPDLRVSAPDHVEFVTHDGGVAHGQLHMPTPSTAGPPFPTIVSVHGGPVIASHTGFVVGRRAAAANHAYWTTRGFAVLSLDYRGTSGYGRAYRRALYGRWGVADTQDAIAAAEYVVGTGIADPDRLVIRGSSAGGYTTLMVLTQTGRFAAATDYYGLSDLEAFHLGTHKFESHYLETLIGPHPEQRQTFRARSPLDLVDSITTPLLVVQGDADPIVDAEQAHRIVDELRLRGVRADLLLLEGEGHGFARASSTVESLETEYAFYREVMSL